MSTPHNFTTVVQQPQHPPPRRRRRRHRPTRRRRHHPQHTFFTTEPPPPTTTTGSSSFGVSDSDDRMDSECGSSGIFSYNHSSSRRMESSSSDGDDDDDDEIDLESGELEMKVHFFGRKKEKKICRICHLNFDGGLTVDSDGGDDGGGGGGDGDGGGEIELGCNCKGDLGTSHKHCAETWFKIKGNLTCEICGATAQNVGADQASEANNMTIETEPADRSATAPMVVPAEQRTFWQGRRVMNILLGCMVFAFIISWLFHFNVLP